ncbi:MAG: type II secretion system protein [Nitrospira sp.]|nr:type II secretion system protein [Nitrospira sp.]TKB74559.1 MAG: type II secretion system protein [Nitrospira sp.]
MNERIRAERGFTLVEMVITVAIVGVLASAAMPLATLVSQRSKEQELRHSLLQVREAIDRYRKDFDSGKITKGTTDSGYPKSLKVLTEGVVDQTSADKKKRLVYLRRVPRDPLHDDPSVKPEETWGLRSYDSPPDEPRSGNDVFDIYSLDKGVGLNGIPYSKW